MLWDLAVGVANISWMSIETVDIVVVVVVVVDCMTDVS